MGRVGGLGRERGQEGEERREGEGGGEKEGREREGGRGRREREGGRRMGSTQILVLNMYIHPLDRLRNPFY